MSGKQAPIVRRAVVGVTLPELLAVLAITAVMVAILFPIFQKVRSPNNGAVRDSLGRPMPGASLCFRDSSGRLVTTITADNYGSFRAEGLAALSKNAVDGFGLTRVSRRTGSGDLYTFTPLGTQIVTCRDESGKPVAGFNLAVSPDPNPWQMPNKDYSDTPTTDKKGRVQYPGVPTGVRLQFLSQDANYVVERVQTIVTPNAIQYAVTVTPPATITGHVLSPTGKPLSGYKPFASIGPDIEHHNRYYARWLVTGAVGKFDIYGLPPGTYYVRAATAGGVQAVTPVQRVILRSGQTATVNVRASDTL